MSKQTGKARNLYIYDNDYAYLAQIGNSYADGLRRAVEAHKWLRARQRTTNNQNAVKGDQELSK